MNVAVQFTYCHLHSDNAALFVQHHCCSRKVRVRVMTSFLNLCIVPCFVYSFYTDVSLHLNTFWNIKISENKLDINTSLIFIISICCVCMYVHMLISVNQISYYTPTELSAVSTKKKNYFYLILNPHLCCSTYTNQQRVAYPYGLWTAASRVVTCLIWSLISSQIVLLFLCR